MNRFLTVLILTAVSTTADALQAGAARVAIEPIPGAPLDGYAYRGGRAAVETHDPLWVRALYLEEGETKLFLVTSDLFAIGADLRQRVLNLAPEVISPENIVLSATGTHNGPGGMTRALALRTTSGPFVPEALEQTAQAFAEAMRLAYEGRRRGTVGTGKSSMRSLILNRYDPGGTVDGQLGVIRVDDSDGNPIAIVANVAALPAMVSKEFSFAFSADFPGSFYGALERAVGGDCVALFMNGAAGDQVFANPEELEGWAHIEWIGSELARETKLISDRIACTEANLQMDFAMFTLPLSIAGHALPRSAVLQTLSIDDALISFVPGTPAADIGLELRRRTEASHRVHFTVGLANDRIGTYVAKRAFGRGVSATETNRYGPSMDAWLYDALDTLVMGEQNAGNGIEPVEPVSVGSVEQLIVGGPAYQAGWQRGSAYSGAVRAAYEEQVVARVHGGLLAPAESLWAFSPEFVDRAPLLGDRVALRLRPLLGDLAPSIVDELMGMADAAELSFDAVWLLHCAPNSARLGTLFAVIGSRAGANDLLVGHSVGGEARATAIIVETRPESGHAYIQVGSPWNGGVITGMNDVGLVVCLEEVAPRLGGDFHAPPVSLVLRDVLRNEGDTAGALDRLRSIEGVRGYHVLVADSGSGEAVLITLGESVSERVPVDGLLVGADLNSDDVDPDVAGRYTRVVTMLSKERIVSLGEVQSVLLDRARGASDAAQIFNSMTRHSVVFEPKTRTVHVAVPESDGTAGVYESATIERGAR